MARTTGGRAATRCTSADRSGKARRVDARNAAPAQERQRVGVQRAEPAAHDEGLALGKRRVHDGLQLLQHAAEQLGIEGLELRMHGRVATEFVRHEDVGEGRMHRVVHPGQRLQGLGARQRFGGQVAQAREPVAQVAHDGHDLRDDLPLHHQRRHLAARVDGLVFLVVVFALVDFHQHRLERLAAVFQQGVRHEGAGAGGEVKLDRHGGFLIPGKGLLGFRRRRAGVCPRAAA
jgi:hypothetical protein